VIGADDAPYCALIGPRQYYSLPAVASDELFMFEVWREALDPSDMHTVIIKQERAL
jgi:hypothetical protein